LEIAASIMKLHFWTGFTTEWFDHFYLTKWENI